MTVGRQPAAKEGSNQDGALIPLVFLQGLSVRQELENIKSMINMKLSLLNEGHLHLQLQMKGVESIRITLLMFNKTKLETAAWRVELLTLSSSRIYDQIK